MAMPITALYAGLLGLVFVAISARVIGTRRSRRISLGDGADADLLARMRVHGNFAEYVPMALLLAALAEAGGASALVIHAAGIALVLGRLSHAYALSQTPQVMPLRVAGMALTFTAIVVAALACLAQSVLRTLV